MKLKGRKCVCCRAPPVVFSTKLQAGSFIDTSSSCKSWDVGVCCLVSPSSELLHSLRVKIWLYTGLRAVVAGCLSDLCSRTLLRTKVESLLGAHRRFNTKTGSLKLVLVQIILVIEKSLKAEVSTSSRISTVWLTVSSGIFVKNISKMVHFICLLFLRDCEPNEEVLLSYRPA